MSRGDKSSYTAKQKRQAKHIVESEVDRGHSQEEAERIAWSTVNKQDGGGKKNHIKTTTGYFFSWPMTKEVSYQHVKASIKRFLSLAYNHYLPDLEYLRLYGHFEYIRLHLSDSCNSLTFLSKLERNR